MPAGRPSAPSGRGPSRRSVPGSMTTAYPANLPPGTSITSPGCSCASDSITSSRRSARWARAASFSSSETRWRSAAYSMKSPRSQVAASAYPASASSLLRSCRASPTTALSAWNWANDISSSSRARVAAELVHEVDRHVVRRTEARPQRIGTGRGEAGDLGGFMPGCHSTTRVPLDVESAASGAAGELGVLPRRDVGVRLAVPLGELLEDHRAGRHVDPEGEGLGGEHGLAQPAHEQLLHALLEGRQHARVVCGDPTGQPVEEVLVAEDGAVLGRQVGAASSTYAKISSRSSGRRQPDSRAQALLDGRVAADPAEDEHDRRQQRRRRRAGRGRRRGSGSRPGARCPPDGARRAAAVRFGVRRSLIRRAGPVVARDPHAARG